MDNFADGPGTTASKCAQVAVWHSGVLVKLASINWIGENSPRLPANLIGFRAKRTTRQKKKTDIAVEAWVKALRSGTLDRARRLLFPVNDLIFNVQSNRRAYTHYVYSRTLIGFSVPTAFV